MSEPLPLTPYADVNVVLHDFLAQIQQILADSLSGMYLDGSLALGDFDPESSDIDFVVTTTAPVSEKQFVALHEMHASFNISGSPWATEIEAIYIPEEVLRRRSAVQPWESLRMERGANETLVKTVLDSSWATHWHVLREHGVVLYGPEPQELITPITPQELQQAMVVLATLWLAPARSDRVALQYRGPQVYTVRTLCRMLYTLEHGDVASKPAAARWAEQRLGTGDAQWAALIQQASRWRKDPDCQDAPSGQEISDTIRLLEYTLERCRS